MALHVVAFTRDLGRNRNAVAYAELEAVAMLEVADSLVDVVVLLGAAKVRPRHQAALARDGEFRLKCKAPILLRLLERSSLIDQEDRRVAGALRNEPALALGHRAKDDAEDQPVGAFQVAVKCLPTVEREDDVVFVRRPDPWEADGTLFRRARTGGVVRLGCNARGVGAVGHADSEGLARRGHKNAQADARRKERATSDGGFGFTFRRIIHAGEVFAGLGVFLVLRHHPRRGEEAGQVPVGRRRIERLGQVNSVTRVVGVGAYGIVAKGVERVERECRRKSFRARGRRDCGWRP